MRKRAIYSPGGTFVGNVGAGEDDLITTPLGANSLAYNGDFIKIKTRFLIANNANQKRVRFYIGGGAAVFDTGATGLAINTAYDILFDVILIRTASNVQKGYLTYFAGAILGGVGIDLTLTDTADITIKGTGETNAASNNDVKQVFLIIEPGEHTV